MDCKTFAGFSPATPCHTIPPSELFFVRRNHSDRCQTPTCQLTEMKPSAGGLRTSQTWSFATCRCTGNNHHGRHSGKNKTVLPPHVFPTVFCYCFFGLKWMQLGFEKRRWHSVTVYQIQWWFSQKFGMETHTVRIWTWEPDKERAIGESGRFKASGC